MQRGRGGWGRGYDQRTKVGGEVHSGVAVLGGQRHVRPDVGAADEGVALLGAQTLRVGEDELLPELDRFAGSAQHAVFRDALRVRRFVERQCKARLRRVVEARVVDVDRVRTVSVQPPRVIVWVDERCSSRADLAKLLVVVLSVRPTERQCGPAAVSKRYCLVGCAVAAAAWRIRVHSGYPLGHGRWRGETKRGRGRFAVLFAEDGVLDWADFEVCCQVVAVCVLQAARTRRAVVLRDLALAGRRLRRAVRRRGRRVGERHALGVLAGLHWRRRTVIDNRNVARECTCETSHMGLALTIGARVRLAAAYNGGGAGGGSDG